MQNEKEPSAPNPTPAQSDAPAPPAEAPQQTTAPAEPVFPSEGTSMGEDPTIRVTSGEYVQIITEEPAFPADGFTKEGDISESTEKA